MNVLQQNKTRRDWCLSRFTSLVDPGNRRGIYWGQDMPIGGRKIWNRQTRVGVAHRSSQRQLNKQHYRNDYCPKSKASDVAFVRGVFDAAPESGGNKSNGRHQREKTLRQTTMKET